MMVPENGMVAGSLDDEMAQRKPETMDLEKKLSKNYSYGFTEDLSLSVKFAIPRVGEIRFNPVVTIISIVIIWATVIWCILLPNGTPFVNWKSWIGDHFTWFYIGTLDICAIFIVFLYFSKYSNIKLGKPEDIPEFSNITWFMMAFACGNGISLFFYGVAEPVSHYNERNRYTADKTVPNNTLAQISMNLTFFHWGIHGWILYSTIGLLLGLMSFRENLPLTMKSCFYPILGNRIFGWIGDLIDILSIVATMFGICTSLGMSARQLNSGFHSLNPEVDPGDITRHLVTIWCITAIATISTLSGLGAGIRRLSQVCFIVGNFLLVVTFCLDDSMYLMNLFVQSIGFYIQHLVQLGSHTDAFEQLGSFKDLTRNLSSSPEFEMNDSTKNWMDEWTLFFWGWWISWSPFVGMFIAKISKGRTIREYLNGTLFAPVLYALFWMTIFGGIGLKQEIKSNELGLCCRESENWFLNTSALSGAVLAGEAENKSVAANSASWTCDDDRCGSCATSILSIYERNNLTYNNFLMDYIKLGNDFGMTSTDRSITKLSCHATEQMWFDILKPYKGIGYFLSVMSLIGMALYFVTSSDSGSLIIDCMSANGDSKSRRIQRAFWSLTEGATATALVLTSGQKGLVGLQAAGIISSLPYTLIIFLLCISIWRSVKVAAGEINPHGPQFAIGLLDPVAAEPMKIVRKKQQDIIILFNKLLFNFIMAPWTVAKSCQKVSWKKRPIWFHSLKTFPLFILAIALFVSEIYSPGCWAVGIFIYLCFATSLAYVRRKTRKIMRIDGNFLEDFVASVMLYPFVAVQLDQTTKHVKFKEEENVMQVVVRCE